MDMISNCQSKLAHFRIKELKDVLTQLGISKQGKKQDLVDRILCLLSDDEVFPLLSLSKRKSPGKERVAKIIDDAFRKMQTSDATDLATKTWSGLDINSAMKKVEDFDPLDMKICCPCGKLQPTECTIQCVDPKCQVEQHVSCVLIPKNPTESKPPIPPAFYCEMCRIKQADPFWITIAYLVLPMKLVDSYINGANPVQSVEQTFQLTGEDQDLLQNSDYEVQVWCLLLNDDVSFRMQWPLHATLLVNDMPVRVVNRPGSQLLGVNGRDNGALIKSYLVEGINKFCLSACDSRFFCFGVRLVQRLTVKQVLSLIPGEKDGELLDDALARVCRCISGGMRTDNEDGDSDVEVIADTITVNLRCPMSGSRIKCAGRFKPCLHMGCFDLETFVELNQSSRKWQCPICLKNYSLEDVIIDPYFNRIATMMRHCGEDVNEIVVKPDGSWAAKTKDEIGDLGHWHHPEGPLFDATNEVTSPRHVEKGYDMKLYSGSEFGIRENLNGILQVSKHKCTTPSSVGQLEEKIEITMSSSSAGSSREEEEPSINQRYCTNAHLSSSTFNEVNSMCNSFDPRLGISTSSTVPNDAAVIILSDSDEENANLVPGTCQVSLAARHRITNSHLNVPASDDGASSLGIFNSNANSVGISSSSHPLSAQADSSMQQFVADSDISEAFIDLEHYSFTCSAPIAGYKFGSTSTISSGGEFLDLSVCDINMDNGVGLVDNLMALAGEDPSLQILLPTQPEPDMEHHLPGSTAASIAALNGEARFSKKSDKRFSDGPFTFPRQPRSVRKRS